MRTAAKRAGTAVLIATSVVLTTGIFAGSTAQAQRATGYAMVRGAHLSPDTPSVDVYLTSFSGGRTALWLTSVGYGDVSPYRRLKAGLYAVSMRPAGAPASSPVALRWTLDARPGAAFTAAAIGMNKDLHGIVLRDQLGSPPAGQARVRVIQAASRAPHATVSAVHGPVLASSAAFGSTTSYVDLPAGSLTLRAQAAGRPAVRTTGRVAVTAGTVDSVVLLDAKNHGLMLRTITDAAGAEVAPAGPVPAGGGGTATRPAAQLTAGDDLAIAAGVVLAFGLGAAAIARRRRVATGS